MMSPSEPAKASDGARKPLPRTFWLDAIISALLALAIGVALAAATPALLQAGGLELPVTAAASPTAPPLALPHRPPEILGHADEDDVVLPYPSIGRRPAHDEPSGNVFDPEEARPRLATAITPLTLRASPEDDADVRGNVSAGQEVRAFDSDGGEWVFVEYQRGGVTLSGWTKRNEIAIR
jgi:hypothetical protein